MRTSGDCCSDYGEYKKREDVACNVRNFQYQKRRFISGGKSVFQCFSTGYESVCVHIVCVCTRKRRRSIIDNDLYYCARSDIDYTKCERGCDIHIINNQVRPPDRKYDDKDATFVTKP